MSLTFYDLAIVGYWKTSVSIRTRRNRITNDGFKNVSLTIANMMLVLRAFSYEVIALILRLF
jgi:hypothetical protein